MAFNVQDLSPEQIQKGMSCRSLEEFASFVKAEGLELDEKEARAVFEEMCALGLSDEELEGVSGGSWSDEGVPRCPDDVRSIMRRK